MRKSITQTDCCFCCLISRTSLCSGCRCACSERGKLFVCLVPWHLSFRRRPCRHSSAFEGSWGLFCAGRKPTHTCHCRSWFGRICDHWYLVWGRFARQTLWYNKKGFMASGFQVRMIRAHWPVAPSPIVRWLFLKWIPQSKIGHLIIFTQCSIHSPHFVVEGANRCLLERRNERIELKFGRELKQHWCALFKPNHWRGNAHVISWFKALLHWAILLATCLAILLPHKLHELLPNMPWNEHVSQFFVAKADFYFLQRLHRATVTATKTLRGIFISGHFRHFC